MPTLSPIDIFNALTPAEKEQVLNVLCKAERKPCERLGHKYKAVGVKNSWLFGLRIQVICTACGKVMLI